MMFRLIDNQAIRPQPHPKPPLRRLSHFSLQTLIWNTAHVQGSYAIKIHPSPPSNHNPNPRKPTLAAKMLIKYVQIRANPNCIIKWLLLPQNHQNHLTDLWSSSRVRTLTGKEIELDIEPDYKVRLHRRPKLPTASYLLCLRMSWNRIQQQWSRNTC